MTIVFLFVLLLVVAPASIYGIGWAVTRYVQRPLIPRGPSPKPGQPVD
jgi:Na+-transporting methylmalonyl-CoA/oxaloacetate decarboxylase gamma subunit